MILYLLDFRLHMIVHMLDFPVHMIVYMIVFPLHMIVHMLDFPVHMMGFTGSHDKILSCDLSCKSTKSPYHPAWCM